jgi:hypothetical protein
MTFQNITIVSYINFSWRAQMSPRPGRPKPPPVEHPLLEDFLAKFKPVTYLNSYKAQEETKQDESDLLINMTVRATYELRAASGIESTQNFATMRFYYRDIKTGEKHYSEPFSNQSDGRNPAKHAERLAWADSKAFRKRKDIEILKTVAHSERTPCIEGQYNDLNKGIKACDPVFEKKLAKMPGETVFVYTVSQYGRSKYNPDSVFPTLKGYLRDPVDVQAELVRDIRLAKELKDAYVAAPAPTRSQQAVSSESIVTSRPSPHSAATTGQSQGQQVAASTQLSSSTPSQPNASPKRKIMKSSDDEKELSEINKSLIKAGFHTEVKPNPLPGQGKHPKKFILIVGADEASNAVAFIATLRAAPQPSSASPVTETLPAASQGGTLAVLEEKFIEQKRSFQESTTQSTFVSAISEQERSPEALSGSTWPLPPSSAPLSALVRPVSPEEQEQASLLKMLNEVLDGTDNYQLKKYSEEFWVIKEKNSSDIKGTLRINENQIEFLRHYEPFSDPQTEIYAILTTDSKYRTLFQGHSNASKPS